MNKSVMKVKILKEAGFEEALLAIALNKKKYDRDMYPVSKKLAIAGGGHDKFLSMISVWLDYTTCRSIHQQIDTYCVGTRKSSESTHHMLIQDVLQTSINRKYITEKFNQIGFKINLQICKDGLVPINNTALLISKVKSPDLFNKNYIEEFAKKYLIYDFQIDNQIVNLMIEILKESFKIDYQKYYNMFEGGSEAITKDTVDRMVQLALSLDENRQQKLHKLKRMLPEGFLQRRIMSCNYQVLKTMIKQRMMDPFIHWQEFCKAILTQIQHPEYFQDILDTFHTSIDELKHDMCNGKPYRITTQ